MRSTASLHDVAPVRSSAGSAYLDPFRTWVEPTGKALNAANEVSFDSVRSPETADLDGARVDIILDSLLRAFLAPPEVDMSTGLFRYE